MLSPENIEVFKKREEECDHSTTVHVCCISFVLAVADHALQKSEIEKQKSNLKYCQNNLNVNLCAINLEYWYYSDGGADDHDWINDHH